MDNVRKNQYTGFNSNITKYTRKLRKNMTRPITYELEIDEDNMGRPYVKNVAQYMYRENRKEFFNVLKEIQTKLPNIEKIEPVRFDNGQMMLKFGEKGFSPAFYSPKMSDGTLKLFAYYLLLHESNPRQLVFIEDPEKGLYHQYLKSLADEMIKSVGTGFSKQLFVTTHSPFFVNALSPRNVWD